MDIQELWEHARKRTEILRMRLQDLSTCESTRVPYIFLAESSVNPNNVRNRCSSFTKKGASARWIRGTRNPTPRWSTVRRINPLLPMFPVCIFHR